MLSLTMLKCVLRVRLYHVGLHPLAVFGPPLVDVLSGRVGAHEADGFDGRVVTDEVHHYTKDTNGYGKSSICGAAATREAIEAPKASNTVISTRVPQTLVNYLQLWGCALHGHTPILCFRVKRGGDARSPSCWPWMMFSVPSGAPASCSSLARNMVHPGTRSEGFIR